MAQDPPQDPRRGGDPAPEGSTPGGGTPDWMDDETWEAVCDATAAGGEPPDLDEAPELDQEPDLDPAHDIPLWWAYGGPAAGFGQGMPLDAAAPCPVLSSLADAASGQDWSFAGVTDDELLGLMSARQRLAARQSWELLMAVAEFIRRRPGAGCGPEGPARMPRVWSAQAASELMIQLSVTAYAADMLLGLAHDLAVKLPVTAAALRDGIIDAYKAQIIAGWCAPLTAAEAQAAEAIAVAGPDVAGWTSTMLRDRIRLAVLRVNPEAARQRREQAAKDTRVEVGTELSGNAVLAGRELPPAAVQAASQGLTARARELRKLGVPGGMDQRRALALLEALSVLDPLANLDGAAGAGGDDGGRRRGAGPDGGGHDGAGPGGGPGGGLGGGPVPAGGSGALPGAAQPGFAAKVNLTVPLATVLGLAERPGMIARIGPVDPALARGLAAAAARHPASTWCVTVTGPDGRPVSHGCGRPAGQPRRGRPGHDRPGAAARDGPVSYVPGDDHGPPGGRATGTVVLDPSALAGTGGGRELAFALEPLAGPCDHKHQAAGHDPGVLLRHLTGILNATCTFPPCRRPEHQSDYEHSQPFEHDGKTCLCEAGPVCRRNHQDKQSPGWHLEEAWNRGWFRWTTPSGRTYLSRPTQYPD